MLNMHRDEMKTRILDNQIKWELDEHYISFTMYNGGKEAPVHMEAEGQVVEWLKCRTYEVKLED